MPGIRMSVFFELSRGHLGLFPCFASYLSFADSPCGAYDAGGVNDTFTVIITGG